MLRTEQLSIQNHPEYDGHEQVLYFEDTQTKLRAIIAVHNTFCGPALGGCRFYPYKNRDEALTDVLRLSKGMTYKSALAGLPLGGGKSVIIGNPLTDKTEDLFRSFGKAIQSLKGSYVTAEDVGTAEHDMDTIFSETPHVAGLTPRQNSSNADQVTGNPSPITAYGTFCGLRACLRQRFGDDRFAGRHFLIQGLGAVGSALASYLIQEGAIVIACDKNKNSLDAIKKQYDEKINIVDTDHLMKLKADVFVPCAMGGVINDETLATLNVSVVAGAANNQLAEPSHDQALFDKKILYAPDYVVNSGGVTSVGYEYFSRQNINPYSYPLTKASMMAHVARIEQTLDQVFALSHKKNIATGQAANQIAESIFRPSVSRHQRTAS
jgi:leucine dehydrogenase